MSISVAEALRPFRVPALMLAVGVVGLFAGNALHGAFFSDRTPVQPIEFSHRIHAGDNQIPCMYCHVQAEQSRVASVPPVSKCMGCHKSIAKDRPEIVKLAEYWERKEPIPWIKVYDVPDFVHFTHKRHIRAGVMCQTCHGEVQDMDRVTRVSDLGMKWCVDCHTTREVEHGRDCWTCHK